MFKHHLFKVNETPIVLGALLLFIMWGANHIISRVTTSPLIEYKISWMDSKEYDNWSIKYKTEVLGCHSKNRIKPSDLKYFEMRITNLSDKKYLKNISIALGFPRDSNVKIIASQLLSIAPAMKGDNTIVCGNSFVKLNKLNFHPLWEYKLIVATEKISTPYVVLLGSDQATILEKSSFKTWITRNEIAIILFSLFMGILLTIWYLIELSKEIEVKNK